MRAKAAVAVGLVVLGAAAVRAADPNESVFEINGLVGMKSLDDAAWSPVDRQLVLGAECAWTPGGWPLGGTASIVVSDGSETEQGVRFEGRTAELSIGARKGWELERLRPWVAAGGAWVAARVEASGAGESGLDSDDTFGWWAGTGVNFPTAGSFQLGLQLRYSSADVNLGGVDGKAGGFAGLVVFGWIR